MQAAVAAEPAAGQQWLLGERDKEEQAARAAEEESLESWLNDMVPLVGAGPGGRAAVAAGPGWGPVHEAGAPRQPGAPGGGSTAVEGPGSCRGACAAPLLAQAVQVGRLGGPGASNAPK